MPLTPLDIHNKEFKRSFRGYSEDEVDDFLDEVIKDYEALYKENIQLKEQLQNIEENNGEFARLEETLKDTLVVAQQTAENIKRNAEKEAEIIIEDARVKAKQMLQEAQDKVQNVLLEYEKLQKQAHVFRVKFKAFLEAQLDLINEAQHEDEKPSVSNDGEFNKEPLEKLQSSEEQEKVDSREEPFSSGEAVEEKENELHVEF